MDSVHCREKEHRLFLFRQDEFLGAVPSAGLRAAWVAEDLVPRRGLVMGFKPG
ncbi:MAG: hypothetical protein ACK4XJ_04085 [Fimbriimonadaceae bacterium]